MIFFCIGCGQRVDESDHCKTYLCMSCGKQITDLRVGALRQVMIGLGKGHNPRVWILYRYQSKMRELLLRAKVSGDYHALVCLWHLTEAMPELLCLMEWADIIMPAPSSLWGRLRGRYDIAGFLAANIAKMGGKEHRLCTARLAFYWEKRALKPRWQKRTDAKKTLFDKLWPDRSAGQAKIRFWHDTTIAKRRILVVDDIYTTGFTMRTIAKRYQGMDIRCLVLAGSRIEESKTKYVTNDAR